MADAMRGGEGVKACFEGIASESIFCDSFVLRRRIQNMTMGTSNPRVRNWAQQIAVWLAIAVLFPCVAYFGTAAFSPPPDADEFMRVQNKLNNELMAAATPAEKERISAEIERTQKENTEAQRAFGRREFWVAYPLGMIAFAIGLYIPIQAVGAGLMFGGIATLAYGCYSSWDAIGRWIRIGSLVLALLLVVILGLWRLGKPDKPSSVKPILGQ
jgi:hypothetical protein